MPDDSAPGHSGIFRIDPAAARLEPLELDPGDFQSALPVQNYHLVFQDDRIGLAVGIWDTTTMQEAFGPYPGDEFITVLDGGFSMVDADGTVQAAAQAGDSVIFRDGIPTSWKQEGYLRKIYLTLIAPDADPPAVADAHGGVTILPGQSPAVAAPPRTLFRNDAGTMAVTLQTHAETALPAAPTDTHELCRILTGQIVLTDSFGQAHAFVAGDHVFVPAGTTVARATRAGTTAYHVRVTA